MDLRESDILGDAIGAHWYYRAKYAALARLTADLSPGSLLDVGAGSGFFARQLLRHTALAEAVCVDPNYPDDHDEQEAGKPIRFRRQVGRSEAGLLLMMDVLEHVPDDVGLAAEYFAKLPAGARCVVTVPAFEWLWSGHDVFLGHERRYTLKQIEDVLRRAGFVVERGAYYFASILPLVAGVRLGGKVLGKDEAAPKSSLRQHGALSNAALEAVCRAELPWFPYNRAGGLSAFVRARKD
ncbi:class I SAM-dependent methyltransferase [Roseomonas sp. NAR14]|uniref:Class I SAM-dependent methyltransferase n=1 Tax=Roseomonas acroporae TaxID=2937791 RepID=A0A9X2BVA5_9PROT|nr:methyltransferase domain-containing protein [Roseomonas acroporae]MCK8786463.1 class I SAM-dependent methyltransferase [Roseomonas acroporae]